MTELTFYQVPPIEIHKHWPFILDGLRALQNIGDVDWLVEDVYATIVNARCECFFIQRGGKNEGFFTSYIRRRVYSGIPELVVWLLWFDSTWRTASEKKEINQFIDSRARYHGCKRVIGESPRMGFKKFGYRIIHHCFVKNLD